MQKLFVIVTTFMSMAIAYTFMSMAISCLFGYFMPMAIVTFMPMVNNYTLED